MSETTLDLRTKVEKELLRTGFPLEMRCTTAFRKRDWQVANAASYVDPDLGKVREIDLVAARFHEGNDDPTRFDGFASIDVVVECKKSSHPWVIITDEVGYQGNPLQIVPHWPGHSGSFDREINLHYRNFGRVGRAFYEGLRRARENDSDDIEPEKSSTSPFGAIMAAAKCAQYLQTRDLQEGLELESTYGLDLYLPVVVFDGRLFEAFLDNAGELVVKESDHLLVLASISERKSGRTNFRQVPVDVVTEQGLPLLMDHIEQDWSSVLAYATAHAEDLFPPRS